MDQRYISDLLVFQAVAEAGSFTRAAARLGRAQSGISQRVLLARSTRSVGLTEAGKRLLEHTLPAFQGIETGLREAAQRKEEVSGTLRLTVMEHPARALLVPMLKRFLTDHPAVIVDLHVSDRFVDIVKGGFDAGIRFGSHLEQDMIAVSVSGDWPGAGSREGHLANFVHDQ